MRAGEAPKFGPLYLKEQELADAVDEASGGGEDDTSGRAGALASVVAVAVGAGWREGGA